MQAICQAFMHRARTGNLSSQELVRFGYRWMQRAKIHPHFFRDHSLKTLAQYIVSFVVPRAATEVVFLTEEETQQICKLFERRIDERVPIEYLTKEAYYLGHTFYVNEAVLVPRSLMSTRFQDFLKQVQWTKFRVLDLCTGSGCIGISLALLDPRITVDLVDISEKALAVAEYNVRAHGLRDRLRCIQSDLFEKLTEKYDLVISNPPYVPEREYQYQPLEVKKEPMIALKGGQDGTEIIRRLLNGARQVLHPTGTVIVEVGYATAHALKKTYPKIPFEWFICRKSSTKDSFLEKLIALTRHIEDLCYFPCLDSIFRCHYRDLPALSSE